MSLLGLLAAKPSFTRTFVPSICATLAKHTPLPAFFAKPFSSLSHSALLKTPSSNTPRLGLFASTLRPRTNALPLPAHSSVRWMSSAPQQTPAAEFVKTQLPGQNAIANWLFGCAGLIFGMVVLGGTTRLTRSGLSMTDWNFFGRLPPMTQKEWEESFEEYKKFPEYQSVHNNITLERYKFIYWMEYSHRMFGRFIGVYFAVPLAYFAARGYVRGTLGLRLGALLGLGACQGLLGWYMVKSGLSHETIVTSEPRVSPYRLAAHLLSAFALYSAVFWTALDLKRGKVVAEVPKIGPLRFLTILTMLFVATTVASGAFVAGMDAGKIYNEYPFMGEGLVPNEYWELNPPHRNFFENPATAQFNHRHLALASLSLIVCTFLLARKNPHLPKVTSRAIIAMTHMGGLQFTLGLATLLMHVPIPVAATHQAGSLVLLTTALNALHALPIAPVKVTATLASAAAATVATTAAASSTKL